MNSKDKFVDAILAGDKLTISWAKRMVDISNNVYCPSCYTNKINPNKETWEPECECGWKGYVEDLLLENESKNVKRTKLIDKML